MALIQCPQCGKSISDKANRCIHCGFAFAAEEVKHCPECGAALAEDETACLQCGCPADAAAGATQAQAPVSEEPAKAKPKRRKKRIIGGIIAAVLIVAVGTLGFQRIQRYEYNINLRIAYLSMMADSIDAEKCGNLIISVWNNAIYQLKSTETDPYTQPDGKFTDDFNVALNNLFSDSDFSKKIDSIKESQFTAQAQMKQLKNPPSQYKETYETLSDFYDAYMEFTNLVVNPTGSLNSFTEDLQAADKEASDYMTEMLTLLITE